MGVFLMSPPRTDWRVHGRANVFSQAPLPPIEPNAALREWLLLADEITSAGGRVVVLSSDDARLTGMPYTAEAGHLGKDGLFLLPNVKPPHRRDEAALVAKLLTSWGMKTRALAVPWEGQGDVIDIGGRYVCTSGEGPQARTSPDAYLHVAPLLDGDSMHLRFRAQPWFHGNTFLACFEGARERVVVVCEDALLPGELARLRTFADARFLGITVEESLHYGTNALQVGARVLAPKGAPSPLLTLWSELGLDVRELELPALFGSGGGAAVCLTNRLAMSIEGVPEACRYESVRPTLVAAP
jgi:N-dimethylarginine dimethylaminohydrolase